MSANLCPCGNPASTDLHIGGNVFCRRCATLCDGCADPTIRDEMTKDADGCWCPACHDNRARSTFCECGEHLAFPGDPMTETCRRCGRVALRRPSTLDVIVREEGSSRGRVLLDLAGALLLVGVLVACLLMVRS